MKRGFINPPMDAEVRKRYERGKKRGAAGPAETATGRKKREMDQ